MILDGDNCANRSAVNVSKESGVILAHVSNEIGFLRVCSQTSAHEQSLQGVQDVNMPQSNGYLGVVPTMALDSEISREPENDTKEDFLERIRSKDLSAIRYP